MNVAPVRLSVLVSDDDQTIREALRDVLQAEPDLEVVAIARDTDEAIALAERHAPAVVVLDVRMPGGGGARAAREIRLRCPGTRVLAFSAYSDIGAAKQMTHSGASEYLLKGVDNAEIVAAVRRLGRAAVRD
jgi:DNA-binding NarL/FixJ family response regulator